MYSMSLWRLFHVQLLRGLNPVLYNAAAFHQMEMFKLFYELFSVLFLKMSDMLVSLKISDL